MYFQARVFIKSALVYLAASFVVGGLLLANQGLRFSGPLALMLPVYYHLLTVGWLTQLICGVALWMFPPLSRERPRGDERLAWVAYGALNSGLLLRAVAEPLHGWRPHPALGWALALAALLQLLAIWLLVAALWPRVKGRATPAPRAPGERRE
ncbi:MAG: hypothetical protein DIU80_022015 [Chloroflexota bacterium]|nr:MAG: hypothetical protein DIU80_16185 [Chloroflexota bacterium]